MVNIPAKFHTIFKYELLLSLYFFVNIFFIGKTHRYFAQFYLTKKYKTSADFINILIIMIKNNYNVVIILDFCKKKEYSNKV